MSSHLAPHNSSDLRSALQLPPGAPADDVVAHLAALVAAFARTNRALNEEVTRLRRYRGLAHRDPLTSLYNRRFLDDRLAEEIKRAQRHSRPLAVVMLDLDGFKAVNDVDGHAAGDGLLARFAEHLRRNVRNEDAVVRYGGDEFCVVMPETTAAQAREIVERLRRNLPKGALGVTECASRVGFSAGVAEFVPGMNAKTLLARADQALYAAKRAGRGRTTCASSQSDAEFNAAAEPHAAPRLALAM